MLKNTLTSDSSVQTADRRQHARVQVRSVMYLELDQDNGGLITNLSEGGIAIQCAEPIAGDLFSAMRFRLPRSDKWIDAKGKLAWLGKSTKEAGIQFLELNEQARLQIQNWVQAAASGPGMAIEQGGFKVLFEAEPPPARASEPLSAGESSEIDSMFPSEKSLPPTSVSGSRRRARIAAEPESPLSNANELALTHSSPETEEATGPLPARTNARPREIWDARSYPPPDSFASRDPFASGVADPPGEAVASGHAAQQDPHRTARAPRIPREQKPVDLAFPVREHYRQLGSSPAPFEEPSGRGWLLAAAILIVLLSAGTVMAIGPTNVKALAAHYFSSVSQYISSIRSPSTAHPGSGPPPPAAADPKTPTAESSSGAPDSESASGNSLAVDDAPQQAILDPGVSSPVTAAPKPGTTARNSEAPTSIPLVRHEVPRFEAPLPSQAQQQLNSQNLADIDEAITRRFQMEHAQSNNMSAPPMASAPVVPASPVPANSNAIPHADNERTLDAYADPSPPALGPSRSAPAYSTATPVPAGTVAISSRFHALRGEDPQQTLARRGLVIGQLLSIHQPVYPVEAERAHVEGAVQVRATVDQTGRVSVVQAISGPPMLIAAAVDAVRQWRYVPTILDVRAVESTADVTVVFRLGNSASSPR